MHLILLAILAVTAYSTTEQTILHPRLLEFWGRSKAEKAIVNEVLKERFPSIFEQSLMAIKDKAPQLHARLEEVVADVRESLDTVGPEAKEFAHDVLLFLRDAFESKTRPITDEFTDAMKKFANRFTSLSHEAQAELEGEFPLASYTLRQDRVQTAIKRIMEANP